GQLRSASRALLIEGNTPAQVLHAMDLFAAAIDGLASTMVCAILDPANGQITYSSAGHPPGLLLRKDRSAWLDQASGTPLGVRFDSRTESTSRLLDKDLVFFYSDGLVERRNESLDQGLNRLRILTEAHWADPVQLFADAVLKEMTSDGAPDDVVLVAARTHTT
ncbi:MAG TPA: PP2C family protein-serine/threonine phosphatase, partial [Microthrixaceae bacterium]|nr:PP2C family protein-serine/threonine phosphatase [Microthrixaceae bacterium]